MPLRIHLVNPAFTHSQLRNNLVFHLPCGLPLQATQSFGFDIVADTMPNCMSGKRTQALRSRIS